MGLIIVLGKVGPFHTLSTGSVQSHPSTEGSDVKAFSMQGSYVPGTAKSGDKMVNQTNTGTFLQSLSSRGKGQLQHHFAKKTGSGCWLNPLLSCVTWQVTLSF